MQSTDVRFGSLTWLSLTQRHMTSFTERRVKATVTKGHAGIPPVCSAIIPALFGVNIPLDSQPQPAEQYTDDLIRHSMSAATERTAEFHGTAQDCFETGSQTVGSSKCPRRTFSFSRSVLL